MNRELTNYRQREYLRDKYLNRHNGREVYDRVKTRQNIRMVAREALNVTLECLYKRAPKETGYGRSAGIRYKQRELNGERLRNLFDIIIGTETSAHSGQIQGAPYMALQNVPNPQTGTGRNEGWIQDGLWDARRTFKRYKVNILVGNPNMLSTYTTKGGSSPPSGYIINIGTYMV
jgi:hypothetical protein